MCSQAVHNSPHSKRRCLLIVHGRSADEQLLRLCAHVAEVSSRAPSSLQQGHGRRVHEVAVIPSNP